VAAGLPLHFKLLVPCLGAMVPPHQFLGSLKKLSLEGADHHSCGIKLVLVGQVSIDVLS
jgi:hypothetical protein